MAYGSIIEMENGKFRVCFDYGIGGTGKRIRKYRTYTSKPEATKALNKHRVQMDNNSFAVPKNITVTEWIDYWYENVIDSQIERTTAYGYNNIIKNYLKPNLGAYKLQKLSPEHIQKYYTKLLADGKLSPNTVIKHHNLLTNLLSAAQRYEYIVRNPMDAVSPPKKIHQEAKFYTPEQLGQLLLLVQGTRLELAVNLCAYLGLRRGELCGLCWANVDFERHTITINHTRTAAGKTIIEKDTKTASSNRVLFIPESLENLLKQKFIIQRNYIESNVYDNNDFVVVKKEDGEPYRPNYLSELFSKFLRDHELPQIVLHELRHTFASLSNAAGIPSFNIGKALGHASPSITQKIYTHILDQTHSSAVQGVAAIADQMREQAKAQRDAPIAERIKDAIELWDPMHVHEYSNEIASVITNINGSDNAEQLGKTILEIFRDSFGSRHFTKTLEDCTSVARRILALA